MLCLLLIFQAVVSFRSIPRILAISNAFHSHQISWIPHFTSTINWSLRLGLSLLKQVTTINAPWIAIMDHSIDIGTKKAFVILRVKLETLSKKEGAIQLSDCECIGLKISDVVNGKTVAQDIKEIFAKSGNPSVIIKDCDATMNKGVRDYITAESLIVPIIDDLGHVFATVLKSQFEPSKGYTEFVNITTKGANKLRQTAYTFLTPPRLRNKGRFQSISKLGQWADKLLAQIAIKGRSPKGSALEKIRKAFKGINTLKPFIIKFSKTLTITSAMLKLLKNEGLNQKNYEASLVMLSKLPARSKVKKRLQLWLHDHLEIQKALKTENLLISSDVIESLFGRFKHVIERSSHADMNRTALLIPALCGKINEEVINRAFTETQHSDLVEWESENIKHTQRKNRISFFKGP